MPQAVFVSYESGVHGANRLASNSLLEGAVFGARAGDRIAADLATGVWPVGVGSHPDPDSGVVEPDASAPPFSRPALQELMWEDAGLVRDEEGLRHAASVLAGWHAGHRTPLTEAQFEDENLLTVAEQLVAAARARHESVGAHYRRDDVPESAVLAQTPAVA